MEKKIEKKIILLFFENIPLIYWPTFVLSAYKMG